MIQAKTRGQFWRVLRFVQARAVDIIMFVVAVVWVIPTLGLFVRHCVQGRISAKAAGGQPWPIPHLDRQLLYPPVVGHHLCTQEYVYHYRSQYHLGGGGVHWLPLCLAWIPFKG